MIQARTTVTLEWEVLESEIENVGYVLAFFLCLHEDSHHLSEANTNNYSFKMSLCVYF